MRKEWRLILFRAISKVNSYTQTVRSLRSALLNVRLLSSGTGGWQCVGKAQVWEGGFREPAIIHWPGKIRPDSVSQAVASTVSAALLLLLLLLLRLLLCHLWR